MKEKINISALWLKSSLLIIFVLVSSPIYAGAKIAIIIDDLGYNLAQDGVAIQLAKNITFSILPHTPYGKLLANRAYQQGSEVMLHMPMQPEGTERADQGMLTEQQTEEKFKQIARTNLENIPYITGVNNHMGSRLTSDQQRMTWLMEVLSDYPALYFVDSRTTKYSVAQKMAVAFGIENQRRHIFLDNEPEQAQSIHRQFDALIARAKRKGYAIAIGHPYPETLAVLKARLSRLSEDNVELIPVSQMLKQGGSSWQLSSSH